MQQMEEDAQRADPAYKKILRIAIITARSAPAQSRRLRNFSVAVKEWNDEIVFVRRVVPGAADRSYGIQVARLAGLPLGVIDRAKTLLAKLEGDDSSVTVPAPQARPRKKITVAPADDSQLNLL